MEITQNYSNIKKIAKKQKEIFKDISQKIKINIKEFQLK